MGAMMRAHDWSASPLGHPRTWPQALRTTVGLMLNSKFPMFVAWGGELGFLYNDSYISILGDKHPGALGKRFHDVWAEIWHDIHPLIVRALRGEASYMDRLPLRMRRHGYDEDTWFRFSYSPVRDEDPATEDAARTDEGPAEIVDAARGLVDALAACGDDDCLEELWEEPGSARPIDAAGGDYAVEVVDEYGGAAAVRIVTADVTQVLVMVRVEKRWLVREVYDLADQP